MLIKGWRNGGVVVLIGMLQSIDRESGKHECYMSTSGNEVETRGRQAFLEDQTRRGEAHETDACGR
jgi:hypothetical protein